MLKAILVIQLCIAFPAFSQTTSENKSETITTNMIQGSSTDSLSSQQPAPIKSTALIGLIGVKENSEGTLTVEGAKLCFSHSGTQSDISASTMEDVVTGDESQRLVRGTLGTLSMFGPYGSGRVLSLFRSRLDSLTIRYRDTDGGLHGVVFTMPVGAAESVKNELVARGARTTILTSADQNTNASNEVAGKERP